MYLWSRQKRLLRAEQRLPYVRYIVRVQLIGRPAHAVRSAESCTETPFRLSPGDGRRGEPRLRWR
jgi:hypothetical protein